MTVLCRLIATICILWCSDRGTQASSNCDDESDFLGEQSTMFIPKGTIPRPENSVSSSNVYDTYNAGECQRIRRPWNAMSQEERSLYIDGLLELRVRGQLDPDVDELIAIGSTHDYVGSITHQDSDYLFWHGYLVWELESRIRNLGGKFRCFGMPYWDFTAEYSRDYDPSDRDLAKNTPFIYETGIGGFGDPNDEWTVNGFSWPVSTDEYWVPANNKKTECNAKEDECPVCSLKRTGYDFLNDPHYSGASSGTNAEAIIHLSEFIDFQRWVVHEATLPGAVDNAFDPIWYLFHSMQSYYQAMWVNCHEYDEIPLDDIPNHPKAFHPYCDDTTVAECVGIKYNDPLYYDGVLNEREWAFIHHEKLTIKKLYSLPAWNIIYDLNGDDFYANTALRAQCKDKLSADWFIVPTDDTEDGAVIAFGNLLFRAQSTILGNEMEIIAVTLCFAAVVFMMLCVKNMKRLPLSFKSENTAYRHGYGSISV